MTPEPDMDQIMLDLLVHEGFLSKQKMKNGKIWYKRTNKKLPQQSQDSVDIK